MFNVDGDCCESFVAENDRESSLGVETGDNVGGVGESGSLVGSAGVFFAFCGGGIIWAGRCCFFRVAFIFLNCFFPSPSLIESPLSLLLFKLVEVSISSSCNSFVLFALSFFSLFLYRLLFSFPLFFDFLQVFFPHFVFLMLSVLAGGDFGALVGDFLPSVTSVHPSSSLLLRSSPVSVGGIFIFSGLCDVADIDGTGAVFVVADTNEVVVVTDTNEVAAVVSVVDVVVTAVLEVFCGHDLEKWPLKYWAYFSALSFL